MKKTLSVSGMTCHKCEAHVKMALEDVENVESVEVDLKGGKAVVSMKEEVSDSTLKSAVEEFGYQVTEIN
ncbi:copper chaperone CopZ [Acetoanaerobium pronyense]|uniref:Copper chaperone CopZ n=1 Tax=Acetoanaerobium pronyense TaxID=1482736 RepID=A0ABS4KMT9_9FIRM|nr:cation transporter [Acetoanaerobium pronyense]MBP2027949.1 copper chaperone CopZ [Acetoanaerobium pronyense]